jgi:hypothetical protein
MNARLCIKKLCNKKIKEFGFATDLILREILTIQKRMEIPAVYLRT